MLQVKRHQPKPAAPAPVHTPSVAATPSTASTSSSLPRTAAPLPATTHNQNRPAPKLLDAARIATNQGAPLDYCRLIVRNLAFDVDETILKQSFATALNASISKKSNGRSMGFGFVVFDNMTECKKARDALNNSVLSGRPMQIDFAQLDDKYSALKFAATLDANKKRKEADVVTAPPAETPAESSAKKAKVDEPKKKMSKKQAKNQVKVQNKLLATYGQKKDLGSALKMFDRMKRRGLQPTVHTYSSMVNACVRCGESQRAEQFVIEMKQHGVVPNEVTYTALMKGLCNADRLQEAVALLPQCQDPNIRTFHALLRGCVRDADGAAAQSVFDSMKTHNVQPDVHAYEYLIKAHAYSLQTDRAWAALLQLTESFPDESLDASLFSTLALACALVNEPELAKKALLGADKLLSKQQSNYLNVESKDSKEGKNGKGADAASHSHAMFERLAADEARRECDRVRMLLVSRGAALSAVLKTYGRFPKCPRVHLQPQHVLNLRSEFAALPDYTKKTKNITHTNSTSVARKMKLEVCSGLGDWVVQHAENEPQSDWIALELRRDRVFQIWSKMVFRELNNLLILGGDAHKIVRDSFDGGVLDEIWINFPEPPGWAGSKLRLIDRAFLLQLHRALKEDAWVTVVTDDRQYAMECVREFQALKDVYCSAFGDEAFLTELPSDYGRASYFDRMWTNGRKDDRFFLRFCKCAPTPAVVEVEPGQTSGSDQQPVTAAESDDDIELDGAEADDGDDVDGSDSDE